MRNRLYLVGGVLLVAVTALWVWSPWEPRQPVYDGKPLSYWLASPPSSAARPLSPVRITVAGFSFTELPGGSPLSPFRIPEPYGPTLAAAISGDTNAVPFLISALKKGTWLGHSWYRKTLQRLPPAILHLLPPAEAPGDLNVRVNAAALLGLVGPTATAAIPALIRASREDESAFVRGRAAVTLGIIGSDDSTALSALRRVQYDRDPLVADLARLSLHDKQREAFLKAQRARREP